MTDRDRLAAGPDPHLRVAPPRPGQRCARCHRRRASSPPLVGCLLCNPEAVPPEHLATCLECPAPRGVACLEGGNSVPMHASRGVLADRYLRHRAVDLLLGAVS